MDKCEMPVKGFMNPYIIDTKTNVFSEDRDRDIPDPIKNKFYPLGNTACGEPRDWLFKDKYTYTDMNPLNPPTVQYEFYVHVPNDVWSKRVTRHDWVKLVKMNRALFL